ncbi:MAG: hypothetical protein ACQEQ0_11730 [Bacteroidota bacterium]
MKHYRIKVRDDKVEFFEELLRYLDFLDYEQVESFSEPRIYTNFELRARQQEEEKSGTKRKTKSGGSGGNVKRGKGKEQNESSAESLREVLSRIDQMRDESRKNK